MRAAAYIRTSWEMPTQRDIGLFVPLFSLDLKFVNTFKKKKKTPMIITHIT